MVMKKLMYLLLGVLFLLIQEKAQAQLNATLRITQVANAEFKTDLFQLVFYGNLKLAKDRDSFGTNIGEGYDMVFTFFDTPENTKKDIMKYSYVGADCIAKFKIWDMEFESNCMIISVTNNEGVIVVTTRAREKLTLLNAKQNGKNKRK
jgi:hypothetical protein